MRPDSLQALPPPPPPAETLSDDAMDCDGRGPAPTAGTDFVVPPVRQSYEQPIDAAGASDDGRPMPGLVAETAAAAPEPAAPAEQTTPWTRPRRHGRAAAAAGTRADGAAPAEATAAAEADARTTAKTAPDAAPAAGTTTAPGWRWPPAPAAAAEGEEMGAPAYTFLLRRREDVNACSNAELIERLTKQAGGLAPPPDLMPETLPRLAWVCDAAPDRYDDDDEDFFGGPGGYKRARCMPEVDLKARCAEVLGEMVALTVAEAGGLHGGEGAPIWSGLRPTRLRALAGPPALVVAFFKICEATQVPAAHRYAGTAPSGPRPASDDRTERHGHGRGGAATGALRSCRRRHSGGGCC